MPDVPETAAPNTKSESQLREETAAAIAEEKQTRERTQTDLLNKQLLTSLLERMNAGDANIQRMMASEATDDDTWETDPGEDPPAT